MKTIAALFTSLVLLSAGVKAQDMSDAAARQETATSSPATAHDVTGFVSPTQPGLRARNFLSPPNPHPNLKPRAGGIFVDGGKYGPVMISPLAPQEYGMGEKYLAAPSQTSDLQHESGPAAHRDAGGLKLLTFEF